MAGMRNTPSARPALHNFSALHSHQTFATRAIGGQHIHVASAMRALDAGRTGGCRRNTRDRRRPARFALRACATSTTVLSARKRLAAGGATSLFHRSPQRPLHPLMSASVSVQYAARVAAGKIERDSAQQRIVDRLAKLETELAEQRLARKSSS